MVVESEKEIGENQGWGKEHIRVGKWELKLQGHSRRQWMVGQELTTKWLDNASGSYFERHRTKRACVMNAYSMEKVGTVGIISGSQKRRG